MAALVGTFAELRVARVFVMAPKQKQSGYQLSKSLEMSVHTIWCILNKFEENRLLTSEMERINKAFAGRPQRKLYALTPAGLSTMQTALLALQVESLAAKRPGAQAGP